MMRELLKYLRQDTFPHMWCPGCGNGIVLGCLLRAIKQLGLDQDKTVVVGGIGCSSRAVGYLDFNTLHTTHGRALAFATGIKLARPELHVIVVTGDGDATAIGGNHFIHAARRNIDLTMILFNNNNYGMTGGQFSPLTPVHNKATTAPRGNIEPVFDVGELARAAGATYVGRSTSYHTNLLGSLIAGAIAHKGFSLVEAITACPTNFGRRNNMKSGTEMLLRQRDNAIPVQKAARMSPGELEGKIVIGLLHQQEAPEYTSGYDQIIALAGEEKAPGAAIPSKKVDHPGEQVELRLGGKGGQGLILAGIILAEAAIRDGHNAVQSQSYGPEARGGASHAEVIIGHGTIHYPVVTRPGVLLVMSQEACDKFAGDLKRGGVLIADSTYVRDIPAVDGVVYRLPLSRAAREQAGKEMVANVVALGALTRITGIVSRQALADALLARVPGGTGELNRKALDLGWEMAEKILH